MRRSVRVSSPRRALSKSACPRRRQVSDATRSAGVIRAECPCAVWFQNSGPSLDSAFSNPYYAGHLPRLPDRRTRAGQSDPTCRGESPNSMDRLRAKACVVVGNSTGRIAATCIWPRHRSLADGYWEDDEELIGRLLITRQHAHKVRSRLLDLLIDKRNQPPRFAAPLSAEATRRHVVNQTQRLSGLAGRVCVLHSLGGNGDARPSDADPLRSCSLRRRNTSDRRALPRQRSR